METKMTKHPARTYLRCRDCLTTVVVEGKVAANPTCAACGGTFARVGVVKAARVFRLEERCACDGRCTNAPGPSCDCSCGGVNHGTGRVVTVEVEIGRAVVRTPDAATAKARAKQFKDAVFMLNAAIGQKFRGDLDNYKAGRWVPRDVWDAIRSVHDRRRRAVAGKVHKARIKAIRELTTELGGDLTLLGGPAEAAI